MNFMPPKFSIQQIAICPTNPTLARELLIDLGLTDWISDNVHAAGVARGVIGENHAHLQFNYQAGSGKDEEANKPLELEILHYTNGHNWMAKNPNTVSHLGMHCTSEELELYRKYFYSKGIGIAQEVNTLAHTNPAIKDSRRYQYAIFDTKDILGVDLKFIVRKDIEKPQSDFPVQGARRKR